MRTGRLGWAKQIAAVVTMTTLLAPVMPAAAAPGNIECGAPRSDALDHKPWPLHRLRPELAWPVATGRGITVAVIDSGVSSQHPKLRGQLVPGRDFVPRDARTCDNTHGTLVASIIAARRVGDPTFYGIAPDARIMPIRVLPDRQSSNDPDMPERIGDAIRWAVDRGAQVINLSLYTDPTAYLEQSIEYATSRRVLVVAAGGNTSGGGSEPQVVFPAAYGTVIAVGGVDEQDKHVSTSVVGEHIDIAAPGVNIEGPAPQGTGYGLDDQGGTSFAAAYVSGVAALVKERYPDAPLSEIRRRILVTADPPPDMINNSVGYGVINPQRAVGAILDLQKDGRIADPPPLPPQRPPADPLAGAKQAAAWIVPIALLVALLLLLSRPVLRRGRSREWQPGGALRADGTPAVVARPIRNPGTAR